MHEYNNPCIVCTKPWVRAHYTQQNTVSQVVLSLCHHAKQSVTTAPYRRRLEGPQLWSSLGRS